MGEGCMERATEQAAGVSLVPPEIRTRTKDDDADEDDWDMTLNRYKSPAFFLVIPPGRSRLAPQGAPS